MFVKPITYIRHTHINDKVQVQMQFKIKTQTQRPDNPSGTR